MRPSVIAARLVIGSTAFAAFAGQIESAEVHRNAMAFGLLGPLALDLQRLCCTSSAAGGTYPTVPLSLSSAFAQFASGEPAGAEPTAAAVAAADCACAVAARTAAEPSAGMPWGLALGLDQRSAN